MKVHPLPQQIIQDTGQAITQAWVSHVDKLTYFLRDLKADEVLAAMGFFLDRCYEIDLNDPRGTDEEDIFI